MTKTVCRLARETCGKNVGICTRLEGRVNKGTSRIVVVVVARGHNFPSIDLHHLGISSCLLGRVWVPVSGIIGMGLGCRSIPSTVIICTMVMKGWVVIVLGTVSKLRMMALGVGNGTTLLMGEGITNDLIAGTVISIVLDSWSRISTMVGDLVVVVVVVVVVVGSRAHSCYSWVAQATMATKGAACGHSSVIVHCQKQKVTKVNYK